MGTQNRTQREIKFRALDKRYGKMESPHDLYISGQGDEALNMNIHDRYIFMQYTGLKDKNGNTSVEVYEGDIIDVDGKVKGNIYEMDAGETDLVIQGFGTKTWCKTYNEAISRGCYDSE